MSITAEVQHNHSNVPRVPGTVELSDFFKVEGLKKGRVERQQVPTDCCYSIAAPISHSPGKPEGLTDVLDRLMKQNPVRGDP